jgi:hypothetical protein
VIATTTKAAAERRGRRTAGRAPARPASRGRAAAVTTTRGGGHRQTPAQKAKADAERARRAQGGSQARTPKKEPR